MSLRLSDRAALRLLRTHVRGCAEDHAAPVIIAGVVIVGDFEIGAMLATTPRSIGFREAEVQDFHRAVRPKLDVRRFQIAVDDPLLVRRFERLGDLRGDR